MPLSENELLERDAQRDIGAELLQAIRDVKAGDYEQARQIAADLLEHPWPMGVQGMGRREDLHDRSALRLFLAT